MVSESGTGIECKEEGRRYTIRTINFFGGVEIVSKRVVYVFKLSLYSLQKSHVMIIINRSQQEIIG